MTSCTITTIKRRVFVQTCQKTQTKMATSTYPTIGSMFTIVTGGATGADTLAETCAKELGMNVKLHLTPHHHQSSGRQGNTHSSRPIEKAGLLRRESQSASESSSHQKPVRERFVGSQLVHRPRLRRVVRLRQIRRRQSNESGGRYAG